MYNIYFGVCLMNVSGFYKNIVDIFFYYVFAQPSERHGDPDRD